MRASRSRVLPWIAIVATLVASLASTPKTITVDVPLENEYARIDGPANAYSPVGLEPLWTYEMRVSFVSTRAARIHFGYDCHGTDSERDANNKDKSNMNNRRLLHAEKLVFSTDDAGRVRDHPDCQLTVWVTSWGQFAPGHNTDDFFYDVVLEKNVIGIPISGLPLVVCALLMVTAAVVFAIVRGDWLFRLLLGNVVDSGNPKRRTTCQTKER